MSTAVETISNNISNFISRHQTGTRLTLTAIAASALTAASILGYQSLTRPHPLVTSKKTQTSVDLPTFINIIDEEEEAHKIEESTEKMDETLVLELLARNIAFFGPEGVDKIRKSFVVVLGAGAVGSWTSLMLVRSGLERIRIVDKALVKLESMTRLAVAKIVDIGKPKAAIMKKYLADIAPNALVETVHQKLDINNLEEILAGNPDFVVDTLSDVRDKVLLAKYCMEHKIKIVSAMSAGAKADPTLMQMTDINDSMTDPLARMYRRQLRKFGIDRGIPVIYSSEKSLNFGDQVPDFRTRTLPVLSPVASMFGLALATYIITQLTDFTAYTLPTNKMRDGVYARLQKEVASKEEFVFGNKDKILNVQEIGYIFDELWQGKSVISGAQDRLLVMTRWNKSQEAILTNTIVLTKEEAIEHDKLPEGTDLKQHYGAEIVDRIEKQFALERKLEKLWRSA